MLLALAAVLAAATPDAGLHRFREVALSPAGEVAAVESVVPIDTGAPDPHTAIVVRSATGSILRRIDPCPTCGYGAPAWSPDGASIAFVVTDRATSTATLTVASGGKLRSLASVRGVAQTPRWSPDGKTIALLATEGATKATGAVEAGAAQVGEIGAADDEQRIAVVPAAGGSLRMVSPSDTFVYEYDWTPDGRGFVATASKGNGDDNWWVAKLIAVDAGGGAARVIASPKTQLNLPRVSPDGKTVVYIGGLMSDFGPVGGDLYAVPFAGGTPVNLTPGMKATVRSLAWKGADPVAVRLVGDQNEIDRVALTATSATFTPLWSSSATPDAADGDVAISRDGTHFAASIEDFEHAPEIATGSLAGSTLALTPITRENAGLGSNAVAKSIKWKNEGFNVQGWLLAPKTLVPGRKYPMITIIHGGPSSATTPSYLWNGTVRQLIERGYYVFQPNPRGSYGQGEAFTRANVRDFGGGDLRDILAGVTAVEKAAPVDDKRLGVYGHSYGGFMTMWTVTHSTRFKAGVAGAGIANWISYYGQNGIDKWMIPFFGASAYDDPAIYTKLSPLTTIKAAKTPTLIYVGERDVECPPAQSVEFWHALKEVGVPTSLIIYAGEGHRIRKPENIHDRETRTIGWFDKYLK
ncbi:S9 family peptidase [Glacieibacterium megasporae]|uniref:S9 family peptidase n=1 Tax=Glacieibacterium megasporae TaxID=2835787 RepID=UPI001C1E58A7|nr:S9 family peptidase [Polymorphobacter megasporae]UAJ11194.1 S9 family peptidase [Polymorphobacter megasporae]